MLAPLVPLVQVNALWAIMLGVGIPIPAIPALSFLLVVVWCEIPLKSAYWKSIYSGSAIVLSVLLLVVTMLMPIFKPELMLIWGVGAAVVALLGLRHGWLKFAPLAMSMLTCAS